MTSPFLTPEALSFIERFITDEVLPLYANTHTESSGTGLQTTRFREDALHLHQLRRLEAGAGGMVRGLAAVAAILGAAAGLDREQRAKLHFVCRVMGTVDRCRAEQQFGERQVEDLRDFLARPVHPHSVMLNLFQHPSSLRIGRSRWRNGP